MDKIGRKRKYSQPSTTQTAENVKLAEQIFQEYGDFIRQAIYLHSRDKGLVDEIYQDFFLSLISNPISSQYTNIKAYLRRAINNDTIDFSRRTKRYAERIKKYAEHLKLGDRRQQPVDVRTMNHEQMQNLYKSMDRMLLGCEATAVKLRYREGYDTHETAERMSVKPRTVSRYVSVGIKKLRSFLANTEDGNNDL